MKKITLLLLALSGMIATQAQTKHHNPFSQKDKNSVEAFRAHVKMMLHLQQNKTANKPTVIVQRVVAQAGRDMTNILFDTTKLKYSGTNGSSYDYNYMVYSYGYSSFGVSPQYYPYNFSKVAVKADSLWNWSYDGTGLVIAQQLRASHNSNGTLKFLETDYFNQGAPDGSDKYVNSFDAQGRHIQLTYLDKVAGNFDSVGKITFTYDNMNRVLIDSVFDYILGVWEPTVIFQFIYNAAGNIDTLRLLENADPNGFVPFAEYTHEFYNDNRLKKVIGFQDMGFGVLEPVIIDTFEYTGNQPFFTRLSEHQFDMNAGTFVPVIRLVKHINNNQPDTMYTDLYDEPTTSWMTLSKSSYKYNASNNPEYEYIYSDTGNGLVPVAYLQYYYELYDNGISGVKNIPAISNMMVYPNPAKDELNITWKEANGQRATIEMLNAAGQKLFTESFNWKEQNQKVSVSSLAPGLYWINVRNQGGDIIYQQSILKQ